MAGNVGQVERHASLVDPEVVDEVAGEIQRRNDPVENSSPSMLHGVTGSMFICTWRPAFWSSWSRFRLACNSRLAASSLSR